MGGILAVLLGGSADTSTSILQNFFKIMALHPEAMRCAQSGTGSERLCCLPSITQPLTRPELDQFVGPDRLPTWQDEASLGHVRSLIKEVHRWAPLTSLGIPHCATADDIFEGMNIRKGTIVFPNTTALSRDPQRYPDPDRFDPCRFRTDDVGAAISAQQKNYMRRDHFQYGFGRRVCPGIHVAEASLFIVISRLLWAFDICREEEHPLDMNDRTS